MTRAAKVLGVHPNTVRSWSDQGRLRYYRINERGDRRYRPIDLQRFLAAALSQGGGPGTPELTRPGGSHRVRGGTGRRHPAQLDDFVRLAEGPAGAPAATTAMELVAALAELGGTAPDVPAALAAACRNLRHATGAATAGVWRLDGSVTHRSILDGEARAAERIVVHDRLLAHAVTSGGPVWDRWTAPGTRVDDQAAGGGATDLLDLAVPIPGPAGPWGILLLAGIRWPGPDRPGEALALARIVGGLVHGIDAVERATSRSRRAEALRNAAADLRRHNELASLAGRLADHGRLLFAANRVAVLVRGAGGRMEVASSSGLSAAYLELACADAGRRLGAAAIDTVRPVVVVTGDSADMAEARVAAAQEGVATVCIAPIVDDGQVIGLLHIAHDAVHPWNQRDLDDLRGLADDAGTAIRTAGIYARMAGWAAHLQSIQSLSARLSQLNSTQQIGAEIAAELHLLIDYHNVRVYRLRDDVLVPVAMRGHLGEYVDETPEQLRVSIDQGLTGWVARHRVPQLVHNAAADPRAMTIPGTEDDLPESMLLAPMIHEDQCLGVLVLSKLGLHQFTEDDLRLLVIFASFAAQAMANADATERLRAQSGALERQLRAQRELIRMTESILTTLDPANVLELITDRLGTLIECDNVAIEVVDHVTGELVPVIARGVDAAYYLEPWEPGETGIATWVVEHNEPALIADERADPRVNKFRGQPVPSGSLIVVPLIGKSGAAGVLTLERLGADRPFDEDEFELVQLFAAQVSIALRNAEVHRAVEIRATTDDLTGLLNHGTFKDQLHQSVESGEPFGLIMIDLDEFKQVNDELGHQAGDLLLVEIGRAIQGAARESDRVFRYGGDEYVVILPRTDAAATLGVAQRIHAAIDSVGGPGTSWGAEDMAVAASMGVATYPLDGQRAEDVLLAADRACFVAKRRGRGRIANAQEGLALAAEFTLSVPTPVDPPSIQAD